MAFLVWIQKRKNLGCHWLGNNNYFQSHRGKLLHKPYSNLLIKTTSVQTFLSWTFSHRKYTPHWSYMLKMLCVFVNLFLCIWIFFLQAWPTVSSFMYTIYLLHVYLTEVACQFVRSCKRFVKQYMLIFEIMNEFLSKAYQVFF